MSHLSHRICKTAVASTLILCLAATLCRTAASAANAEAGSAPAVVILLGDSIRMQYQKTVRVELEGKATVWSPKENCCHTRYTLERLEKWVKGRNASVVHVNAGLHDLYLSAKTGQPRHSLEVYSANLRAIFAKLKELTDADIVFALTTPVVEARQVTSNYKRVVRGNPQIAAYNRRAVEIAKEMGVRIDDLHAVAMEAGAESVIGNDGVHLSRKGVAVIGKQVARCLLSVLSESAPPE